MNKVICLQSKWKLIPFLLLFACITALGQNYPEDKLGNWFGIAVQNKLTHRFQLNVDMQLRYYELGTEFQNFNVRTGLGYNLFENFSTGLGYAYFRNDPSYETETPKNFDEHRLFLDIVLNQNIKKFRLTQRIRPEERILVMDSGTANQLWIRYLFKVSYPITDKITLDTYDEPFLKTESPVFAQNWLGAGVTYNFLNNLSLRMGYQKISLKKNSFDRILASLNIKTDFFANNK